ncbi:MAG: histidine--tRNA ligase [archaeon]
MPYQTVKGMRDFLPEQAKKKQFIEDVLRRVFESYGYEPLQTPIVEEFDLLAAKGSGGEAIKEEIYWFRDKSERELGLRYDLTVPFARVVATNRMLQRPFKRYCISTVYRYDRPQAKRYREFTQADVDIAGVKSVMADFEILQISVDVMRKLGFEFKITVNNRVVLEELAKSCGVSEEQIKDAFRSIDKLDKIGEKEVRREFREKGIDDLILDKIFVNSLEGVKEKIGQTDSLKELEEILELCKANNFAEVVFDLSLARGLEYYTGNVFEIKLNDGPSMGAGGRYDKLIGLYGGEATPAVGISFGVDRLFDALEPELIIGPNTDLFIMPFSKEEGIEATKLASKIRSKGVSVEIDLAGRNIKKNFEYANKRSIPFVIVLGENELKGGRFKLKELATGKEEEFSFEDAQKIASRIKGLN